MVTRRNGGDAVFLGAGRLSGNLEPEASRQADPHLPANGNLPASLGNNPITQLPFNTPTRYSEPSMRALRCGSPPLIYWESR